MSSVPHLKSVFLPASVEVQTLIVFFQGLVGEDVSPTRHGGAVGEI